MTWSSRASTARCVLLSLALVHVTLSEVFNNVPPSVEKKSKAQIGKKGDDVRESYIVQHLEEPIITHRSTKPDKNRRLDTLSPKVINYRTYLERKHDALLAPTGGVKTLSYTYSFNGFAARLTQDEARALEQHGEVLSVTKDSVRRLQTKESAAYLGLSGPGETWSLGYTGEDVVVGVIDGGIHPEHPSFADGVETPENQKDSSGLNDPYGPPPQGWTANECEFGNYIFNPNDKPANCSNKVLTARCFCTYFSSVVSPDYPCGGDGRFLARDEFLSARDAVDHGTHIASTAAGNNGVAARDGTITGMAPRARLAIYKCCWKEPNPRGVSCAQSDIVAAVDQAVADGVDVINYSMGVLGSVFNTVENVALLRAVEAGIFVATSNGNGGPEPYTIGTPAALPWVTSVGAASDNSIYGTKLSVNSPFPDVFLGISAQTPVELAVGDTISSEVVPAEPLNACGGIRNDVQVQGKIVLVIRGTCSFTSKFEAAAQAGAKLIVVYNDGTKPFRMRPISMTIASATIPGMMISFHDGDLLRSTADEGKVISVDASHFPAENRIAEYSSRGPNLGALDIIKPDIVAPGVSILAASSPFNAGQPDDGDIFLVGKGTSVASPHVAGIFALLKQVHPDWSPAAAKSALMTTARQNLKDGCCTDDAATPFDMGSGYIVPGDAFDPGLVFDARLSDYKAFSCVTNEPVASPSECLALPTFEGFDLNYPSIGVGEFAGMQTVKRTVTSVSKTEGVETFTAIVDAPPGIMVTVTPSQISLEPGQSVTYEVTFTATAATVLDEWAFGSMRWTNEGSLRKTNVYSVYSPIALKPKKFDVPSSLSLHGVSGSTTYDTRFGYSGWYMGRAYGLSKPYTVTQNVSDDPFNFYDNRVGVGVTRNRFEFGASVAFVRFALFDDFTGGNDDLDLYVWACDAEAFCKFVGHSGTTSSNEQVDVHNPYAYGGRDSHYYLVDVHGYETSNGSQTTFTLFQWEFLFDDNPGNMVVNVPTEAVVGATPTSVTWRGLDSDSKYLGAVQHNGPSGELGMTLIEIET